MECFAGLAASATVGHATFDYNRENFMYDRELRQKKELHMLKYRVCQSEQWRSDIRDLISLTEKKMHIYLLVNVLLLGFAVTLWCEGRLPPGTPPWMMLGQAISTAAAFMFLLLSIWFAMHAAVAAQSFEVRLLTQMVRLPIPSWQELEATRTYGSEFEHVEARQMFRVPFLMGRQESLIPRPKPGPMRRALSVSSAQAQASGASAASPPASAAAAEGGAAESGEAAQEEFAADPWGLEGTGENIEELGCPHGSEVGKCRHVKLALKAAIHWQSYDAFARIAMSMGVNQLLLAIAYYLLGYVFVEVGVRSCAFLGVALLVLMQEALTRLDMSLNPLDLHLLQLLLFAGPVFMCLASYFWSKGTELGNDLAGSLIPFAFLMHGLYVLLMTRMCRIQEQPNGAMLPMALGSVLFLDVFGHMHNEDTDDAEDTYGLDAAHRAASKAAASEAAMQDAEESALDAEGGLGVIEEEEEEEGEPSGSAPPPPCRPALEAIQYKRGRPKPVRLTDAAPPGAVPDMRNEPGAPSHLPSDRIDGDFYEPGMFFHDEPELSPLEKRAFTTGHEHEKPGIVPWNVFRTAMLLLWIAWVFGAIYAGLQAASIWSAEIPYNEEHEEIPLYDWIWDNHVSTGEEVPIVDGDIPPPLPDVVPEIEPDTSGKAEEPVRDNGGEARDTFRAPLADKLTKPKSRVAMPLMTSKAKAEASLLQIARMGLHGLSVALGRSWEELEVTWPDGGLPVGPSPHLSLSCDATGQQLAISNGLLVWTADVPARLEEERGGLNRLRGSFDIRQGRLNCSFAELRCPGFAGEALQDTALTCSAVASNTSQCTTWVLHREGQKLTACDHHPAQAALPQRHSRRMNVSGSWLERVHIADNAHSALAEMPETLTVDSLSKEGGWSGFIGTNLGRIVRASQFNHETGSSIAPVDILHEGRVDEREKSRPLQAGPVRSFNKRYIGMLNRKRQSLEVLDAEHGGEHVGRVALPAGVQASGFCAGGGFVYLVGAGHTPKLWRMSVPSKLRPLVVHS